MVSLIIERWPDKRRWPSILDLMPIHQFHLSREREAEYRLALPRSEVAAGGSLRRHADRCDDRLGLGEQGRVDN